MDGSHKDELKDSKNPYDEYQRVGHNTLHLESNPFQQFMIIAFSSTQRIEKTNAKCIGALGSCKL
jgi:hypothetical protein